MAHIEQRNENIEEFGKRYSREIVILKLYGITNVSDPPTIRDVFFIPHLHFPEPDAKHYFGATFVVFFNPETQQTR